MAIRYFAGNKIVGLTGDTKPINVMDGSTFYESDTGKIYSLVSGSWTEMFTTKADKVVSATEYSLPILDTDGNLVNNPDIVYDSTDPDAKVLKLVAPLELYAFSTSSYCLASFTAKGSKETPIVVDTDQPLLDISVNAWNGTEWKPCAAINYVVEGAVVGETVPSRIVFVTTNADGDNREGMSYDSNGNLLLDYKLGIGTGTPDAPLEVETAVDLGKQAVSIDQKDEDQAFVDYQGTSEAGASKNISSWTSATIAGYVKVEINGSAYWMPYYNAPTS